MAALDAIPIASGKPMFTTSLELDSDSDSDDEEEEEEEEEEDSSSESDDMDLDEIQFVNFTPKAYTPEPNHVVASPSPPAVKPKSKKTRTPEAQFKWAEKRVESAKTRAANAAEATKKAQAKLDKRTKGVRRLISAHQKKSNDTKQALYNTLMKAKSAFDAHNAAARAEFDLYSEKQKTTLKKPQSELEEATDKEAKATAELDVTERELTQADIARDAHNEAAIAAARTPAAASVAKYMTA